MNDVARAQAVARYNFGIARRAAAESTAFGEKAGSGGAMDRAVHAAAEKRRIGGAHNGVDVNARDILLVSRVWMAPRLQGFFCVWRGRLRSCVRPVNTVAH